MSVRWRRPAVLAVPTALHARPSLLISSRPITVGCGVLATAALAVVGLIGTHGSPSAADTGARHRAGPPSFATHSAAPDSDMSMSGSQAAVGLPLRIAAPTASSRASGTAGPVPAADTTPASVLAASGLPATALTAYENAAARERAIDPSCRLSWPLLAGIGRIESNHGRFGGAVLHSDGLSTPPVIGIPLNGIGTALIRDTDHGRLDGDLVFDRAVGPMQFIPSTWASWGVDADHDGTANPFDINDAAAAAADYLCAAGRDLSTVAGQVQAVSSYNHSAAYVASVLGVERVYAGQAGVRVPVLPTGPDPGLRLPAAGSGLAPVDPGAPRGLPARAVPAPARRGATTPAASTSARAASSASSRSGAPRASSTATTSAPASSAPSSTTPGCPSSDAAAPDSAPAPGSTSTSQASTSASSCSAPPSSSGSSSSGGSSSGGSSSSSSGAALDPAVAGSATSSGAAGP